MGTEDVLPWAFCVFFGDQAREPPSDTLTWPLHDSAAPRQQNKAPLFNSSVCTVTSVRAFSFRVSHGDHGTREDLQENTDPSTTTVQTSACSLFDTHNANIPNPTWNGNADGLMMSGDLQINLTIINFQAADSNVPNRFR